jgi:hypothetical protein
MNALDLEPGSKEAVEKGCICTLPDTAGVLDATLEEITGFGSSHATGIPQWDTRGCPIHDPQLANIKDRKLR